MTHTPTIRHIIDTRAGEVPDKTYLIAPEPGLSLTYGRLRDDSVLFTKYLREQGLNKGDKVSFMLSNGYQTTKIFLGCLYGGFCVAPINLHAQTAQLEYTLDHSDTKLIFYTEDHRERLETALDNVGRDVLLIQIDHDAERIFPENDAPSGTFLEAVNEEDDALLLYTSGTTGLPKGVILSQRSLISGGMNTSEAHRLTPEDRALCSLPLYHINGEIVTTIGPLVSQGSVVMPHRFSTTNFWELISEYACTWFSVVPTIISYLYSATELGSEGPPRNHLRFGRSASSSLPPSLQKAFEDKFKVPIIETMGLTETAGPITSNPMDDAKRKRGSIGLPVGNEIRIVDRSGCDVPACSQGEILVPGDNVMKGYYKAPEITKEAIERDGWFHTGDLGCMDEEGFIFVTGRIKELIIKGGENIAPKEIDEAMYRHPAVLEAAAVGIPDDDYGEEIMCCLVLRPGHQATEEELRIHCREYLGPFKTPKVIKIMDDLPKGPSGKIQRRKLLVS